MTGAWTRTLPALTTILVLLAIGIVASQGLARSLWVDETMAMSNYPLPGGLAAIFDPLPFYAQAAPPLFSALMHMVAEMAPSLVRAGLLLALMGVIALAVGTHMRSMAAIAAALLALLALRLSLHLGTELKYYGLEIAGGVLICCWAATRRPDSTFGLRDALLLTLSSLLGISTIPLAGGALALAVGLRLLRRPVGLGRKEVVAVLMVLAVLAGYYLLIRRGTTVQIDTYFDAYGRVGLAALMGFARSLVAATGLYVLPLLALALAVLIADWQTPASRGLVLFVVLGIGGLAVLCAVGLYPASAPRHMAAVLGLLIALVAGAAARVGPVAASAGRFGRPLLLLAAASVALAAVELPRRMTSPDELGIPTDNQAAIEQILAAEGVPVGLWGGAQPAYDYYSRTYPDLKQRTVFGRLDPASLPLPPDLRQKATSPAGVEAAGVAADALLDQPGAWGLLSVFDAARHYDGLAEHLVSAAPRGTDVLVFASQVPDGLAVDGSTDAEHPPGDVARMGALRVAFARHGCSYGESWRGRNALLIVARC